MLDIQAVTALLYNLESLDKLTDLDQRQGHYRYLVYNAYRYRKDDEDLLDFCLCVAWRAFEEYSQLLAQKPRGATLTQDTFATLAQLLAAGGHFSRAIQVCEEAHKWGLKDGTKSGYLGRAERLKKAAKKGWEKHLAPSPTDPYYCSEIISRFRAKLLERRRAIEQAVQIPPFPSNDIRTRRMSPEQREFYAGWVSAWEKGDYLELYEQANYAFKYVVEKVLFMPPLKAIPHLTRLVQVANGSGLGMTQLRYRCLRWASDFYILSGEYQKAIQTCELPLDDYLSLKLLMKEPLTGSEVLQLFGLMGALTDFGRERVKSIEPFIDRVLLVREEEVGENLLGEWAADSDSIMYRIFQQPIVWPFPHFRELGLRAYRFTDTINNRVAALKYKKILNDIVRQAENDFREQNLIPRVGEGWVSETHLFKSIQAALPNYEVQQHASPDWLGRQHLDIYIPHLRVAVEYQGPQHDQPVEYFGGTAAFEEIQQRDVRKRQLCQEFGVRLIYVRPEYDFDDVLVEILAGQ
jgi:hypothetical protein